MGHEIRLIVLDIDGTIAGISNEVSPSVQQAVAAAQAKGVKVAIATGRMYRSAERFHHAIGSDMPLAAYQGALVRDPRDGRIHHHRAMPSEVARDLLAALEPYPLSAIHVYIDDCLYIRDRNPLSDWYAERSRVDLHLLDDLDPAIAVTPTKVLGMTEDTALIDELLASMRDRFSPEQLYLTKSVPTFFEAANPGINKGVAVKYMAEELLGLTQEQVMVCGDSHNDLEMLDYAGVGVVMGNGPNDVRARGHWIAPSVDRDGVAAAIEEFVL